MTIEIIPEMALSPADEAAIANLLKVCFDTDFGGRSFFIQRHHLRLVMRDGGRVVGHMALLFRAIRAGGKLVDIIGLAEVATAPDRRGEGIAGAMLQSAIAQARASVAKYMMLFGTAGLYAGAGFLPASNVVRHVSTGADQAQIEQVSGHMMVMPLQDTPWDHDASVDLRGPKF